MNTTEPYPITGRKVPTIAKSQQLAPNTVTHRKWMPSAGKLGDATLSQASGRSPEDQNDFVAVTASRYRFLGPSLQTCKPEEYLRFTHTHGLISEAKKKLPRE